MIVRINFTSEADVTTEKLKELEETICDTVDCEPLYKKGDGSLTTFYSWQHILDSSDPRLKEENTKYQLVTKTNLVRLHVNKEYIVDLDLFLSKHPEIKINLRGMVKTLETNYDSIISQMQDVQSRMENALKGFDKQVEFNQKCDVHVANLGLLHINQVGYAVDFCTEQLQELLNVGWRIIACCVQPDGRRPDYILGRYNPLEEEKLICVKF